VESVVELIGLKRSAFLGEITKLYRKTLTDLWIDIF